jgi:cation diffusion facilitator family transporter
MSDRLSDRSKKIVWVLWGVLVLNLAVAFAKLWYARVSGALSIQADGLHSLIDGSSNVIGIVGVMVASRPPDANHPYGHRKYETFAALAVAVMMFFGCWQIAESAFARVHHPVVPRIGPGGFVVLLATLAVNLGVTVFERRAGKALHSEMLLADAAHTGSDVLATVLVLLGFVAMRLGWVWADLVAAALVVAIVVRTGLEVLRGTLSTLSDERRIEPGLVEREALLEEGALEVHNVRSRGPLDDVHVDLHVLVDPRMPIADAHAIGHRVERRLVARWPGFTDVVVHVEPALPGERARVREGGGLRAES